MIRINLLPFRAARRRENVRRQTSIFFLSVVLVAIGLFYYHLTFAGKIAVLNAQADTLKTELKKKRKAAREVDKIKKDLDLLKIKMEGIRTVKKRRREPVQMLETMTEVVIPKRMWFTSLSDNYKSVGIKGFALDQKTVADFMTRLESTNQFSNVNLGTLKHVKRDDLELNIKEFEITCEKGLRKPEPEAQKEDKKKK